MVKIKSYKQFNESRKQLEIPFDGEDSHKPHHVNFIDALEDLAVKMSYSEDWSWESFFNKGLNIVSKNLDKYVLGDYNLLPREWLYTFDDTSDDNIAEFFDDHTIESAKDEEGTIYDWVSSQSESIDSCLSKKGRKDFNSKLPNLISTVCNDLYYAIDDSFSNNGYMEIYREIVFDSNYKLGFDKNWGRGPDITLHNPKDLYEVITKAYKGVGSYWTWDENKAESYWNSGGNIRITLHGLCRPEDINWEQTIGNACSDLEEKEITLNQFAYVKIVDIEIRDTKISKSQSKEFDPGLIIPIGYA